MNEKFLALPEEKRQRMINAGLEAFSENEYKKASADSIAERAGISKGLLFYYFRNKKEFYIYLFDYASNVISSVAKDESFNVLTDLFELWRQAMIKKYEIYTRNPFIINFLFKVYYTWKVDASEDDSKIAEMTDMLILKELFSRINTSKFKDGINPTEIIHMLTWMTEGYLFDRQRKNLPLVFEETMKNADRWSSLLKQVSYKEEYL